jgi:hypothetical protein
VRPYILLRKKTDKAIIADLARQTELKTYCGLSRKQAAPPPHGSGRRKRSGRKIGTGNERKGDLGLFLGGSSYLTECSGSDPEN